MLYIEDGVIAVTRGDDAALEVAIHTAAGADYQMSDDDTLTLTVRALPSDSQPVLLSVTSTPGSARLVLRGADTAGVAPGKYSCDVQLKCADGSRYTVFPIAGPEALRFGGWENFIILPEVTVP